jgi:heat shock protein HtpX
MASSRSAFQRDIGLQMRMLLTLFLLGLLYAVFVVVLLSAGAGVGVMLVVVCGLVLAQLFLSDKIALAAMGAKQVSAEQAPELHSIIERLCIQADLPKPRVAIVETSMPNAFAMGRSPKNAVVCATTGITELLAPHELEGVLAHELAHVKHRDVLVMTIASFFASVAAIITQFGFFFGGGGDDNEGPGFIVVLLVSLVVYVISFLLMNALSRYREFAADRGAALTTGRPSALASALMRISGQMQRIPQQDLRSSGQMNAFFIVPTSVKSAAQTIFSTHPPMEKRIKRLEQLEAELQGTS